MKKITIVLKVALVVISLTNAHAQIINGDFETIKPVTGLASNWGKNYSVNRTLDTATGITTSDEIQYSGCSSYLCYPTPDAHSGDYALEMTNFYNISQDKVIVGGAVLFEDATQDSPPGGNYNSNSSRVPFDPSILYGNQGLSLGFYYKFSPAGNDVAEASLELFDVDGNSVGKLSVPISGVNIDYNYIYAPVSFTSTETPVSMSLSFTMAMEGSTPTFGSNLIIDDVTLNNAALQIHQATTTAFMIYPTVAHQEITIQKSNSIGNGNYSFEIIDSEGRKITQHLLSFATQATHTIDVSLLSNGIYFIRTQVNGKEQLTRFIKK